MAYLRIATHPVSSPSRSRPPRRSTTFRLLNLPRVRVLSEGEGFLQTFREVTAALTVRGNLVPDAHLAAVLRQRDVRTLYTADADFRRFDFLDVRDPFS
jgi:predicted nucleic acid-binding protein